MILHTNRKILSYAPVVAITSLLLSFQALANPQGGEFIAGSGTISNNGAITHIEQYTHNAITTWDSFDVQANEHVNIEQPSTQSNLVNIIDSADPSLILGQINANGNLVLLNKNGIVFGETARVDVNGIVASTSSMREEHYNDFITHGTVKLDDLGENDGFIINNGHINAQQAGLVGMVAPHVENNGLITAHLGRVHLASGEIGTLDFFGDGLLEVSVGSDLPTQSVINTGTIKANGGVIALNAQAGKEIIDSLIIASGELHAPSFAQESGKIIIYGEGANAVKDNQTTQKNIKTGTSTILVNGHINAAGQAERQTGGQVEILGDEIAVLDNGVIDVSGEHNAGSIKIGGDYLGKGHTPTARHTYVAEKTVLMADSKTQGNGGRIIIWSDDTTTFHGNIFARGGHESGNGGFVETSGKQSLQASGFVDLTARNTSGTKGTYLLDPENITIYGHFNPLDISGNVLWLDSSDRDTILDINGNIGSDSDFNGFVATWLDKSGYQNNLSNVDNNAQPSYNNGVVHFDGFDALYANSADVPALNFSNNNFSFYGVIDPTVTTQERVIFSKERSYSLAIRNQRLQAQVETQDTGNWNWGGTQTIASNLQKIGFQHADTAWNFFQNGALLETASPANNETGNIQTSDHIFAIGGRGETTPTDSFFTGSMGEIFLYNQILDIQSQNLLSQYQAAKWDIALKAPGSGLGEIEKATAPDGYSVFTTRYLERLSQTADIHLLASDNITLDLKGDTISLADDRSLSLTSNNGDIQAISSGTILTNRTRPEYDNSISFNTGGEGNIDVSLLTLETRNGGQVYFDTDNGTVVRHQNYVAPSPVLPSSAETRMLTSIDESDDSQKQDPQSLDDLVSFSDMFSENLN